jgi:hypothetical protein
VTPARGASIAPVPDPVPSPLPARNRPSGRAVPPARMPAWRHRRPLKRWRYIGLFGPELSLCAGSARVAGVPHSFWVIFARGAMRGRTATRAGLVNLADGVLEAGPATLRWRADGEPVEVVSEHGGQGGYIWTRKQPIRATGTVDGRALELRGLLDDSAGYHARHTTWHWCAGIGEADDGSALAFNLVEGLHDAPTDSERTAWVDGVARELPAAAFADDLSGVTWSTGERLAFTEEGRRARHERFGLIASDYVQPFGTLEGTLPGDVTVAHAWGVMEHRTARW